jgi:acyloxyacyl hydrolase
LTDLIEPADGFHPSQTGNALFAQKFFQFLEQEHPEAIGPINPYNAEIDAMFFNDEINNKFKNKVNV